MTVKKLLVIALSLMVVGCANTDMSDLHDFVAEVKARSHPLEIHNIADEIRARGQRSSRDAVRPPGPHPRSTTVAGSRCSRAATRWR